MLFDFIKNWYENTQDKSTISTEDVHSLIEERLRSYAEVSELEGTIIDLVDKLDRKELEYANLLSCYVELKVKLDILEKTNVEETK